MVLSATESAAGQTVETLIHLGLRFNVWLTIALSGSLWAAANPGFNLPNWVTGEQPPRVCSWRTLAGSSPGSGGSQSYARLILSSR